MEKNSSNKDKSPSSGPGGDLIHYSRPSNTLNSIKTISENYKDTNEAS